MFKRSLGINQFAAFARIASHLVCEWVKVNPEAVHFLSNRTAMVVADGPRALMKYWLFNNEISVCDVQINVWSGIVRCGHVLQALKKYNAWEQTLGWGFTPFYGRVLEINPFIHHESIQLQNALIKLFSLVDNANGDTHCFVEGLSASYFYPIFRHILGTVVDEAAVIDEIEEALNEDLERKTKRNSFSIYSNQWW